MYSVLYTLQRNAVRKVSVFLWREPQNYEEQDA